MRFGGFSSYEKFADAWRGYGILLPVDWPILNIYLAGYPGTPQQFVEERVPEELRSKVLRMLTYNMNSAWCKSVQLVSGYTESVIVNWQMVLALGQAFDINPNLFVDEPAFYTQAREMGLCSYFHGIKYHKIPFVAWEQGVSLEALIPDYYQSKKSPAERRRLYIENTLKPKGGPGHIYSDYRIKHIMDAAVLLGVPFKDFFMQLKRTEITCYAALSNVLERIPAEDMYLLYGIGEAMAASLFKDPEELKQVLCALVDRRKNWVVDDGLSE